MRLNTEPPTASVLRALGLLGLLFFTRGQLFPATLELSRLGAGDGRFINGAGGDTRFPNVVSFAGDVNADGIADFLIAARFADPSASRAVGGKIYVVFGRRLAPSRRTSLSTQLTSRDETRSMTSASHFSITSMTDPAPFTSTAALRSPEQNFLAFPLAISGGICAGISSVVAAILVFKCRRKPQSSETPSQVAGESTHYASLRLRASAENDEHAYGLLELKPPEVTFMIYSSGPILSDPEDRKTPETHYSLMPDP